MIEHRVLPCSVPTMLEFEAKVQLPLKKTLTLLEHDEHDEARKRLTALRQKNGRVIFFDFSEMTVREPDVCQLVPSSVKPVRRKHFDPRFKAETKEIAWQPQQTSALIALQATYC